MKTRLLRVVSLGGEVFAAGFLVNLIWEALHVSLYHGGSYLPIDASVFSVWLWPTLLHVSTIDGLCILALYAVVAFLRRDFFWIQSPSGRDMALVVFLGLVIASFIEVQGLAGGKWGYGPLMPIVPILEVGLTPFLQLAATALLSFFLVRRNSYVL